MSGVPKEEISYYASDARLVNKRAVDSRLTCHLYTHLLPFDESDRNDIHRISETRRSKCSS